MVAEQGSAMKTVCLLVDNPELILLELKIMNWLEEVKKHCRSTKEEVCGFIYFNEKVVVEKAINYADNKKNVFEAHPLQYLKLKKNHKNIVIYHSHLCQTCEPSERDKESSQFIAAPFLIYDVYYDRYSVYFPPNVRKEDFSWLE